jgi:hypothetical protein
VNAAFNIASRPLHSTGNESITEQEEARAFLLSKKQMRRLAKAAARHEPMLPTTPGTHAHAYGRKGKPARGAGISITFFPLPGVWIKVHILS